MDRSERENREIAALSTCIRRPIGCEIERVAIGDYRVWMRADRAAQQWDARIIAPILQGDEYELHPIHRDGHDVRTVVDVGGHVGAFALKVKRFWPQAKVIGIEPDPLGALIYRTNVEGLDDVHVIEGAAVGAGRDQNVMFHRDGRETNNAASSYVREVARDLTPDSLAPERQGDIAVVPGIRIPALLAEHGIEQIDILKLDCEGAEAELLEDLKASGWLKRTRWLRGEWHFEESIPRIRAAVEPTHVLAMWIPPAESKVWNGSFLAHRRGDAPPVAALQVGSPAAAAQAESDSPQYV